MNLKRLVWTLALICLIELIAGCGNPHYRRGRGALGEGEYRRAVNELLRAVKQEPGKAEHYRELGVAYFSIRRFNDAIRALDKARRLAPSDGRTLFYLGYCHELKGDFERAIEIYSDYNKRPLFDRMNDQIKARMTRLSLKLAELEVRDALRQEDERRLTPPESNTIAVVYFRNVSEREKLSPLIKGLAAILTTDLGKLKSLQLVERNRMEVLLREINMSASGLYDQFTAPRAGRILGAGRVIVGGATTLGTSGLQLDAGIVNSATSRMVGRPIRVSGRINEILQLEKQLVFALIEELDIRISETEREAIQKLPTESTLAFVSYCQGLAYADSARIPQAIQAFERALYIDPGFQEAKDNLVALKTDVLAGGQLIELVTQAAELEVSASEEHLNATEGILHDGVANPGPLIPPASRGRVTVSGKLP